MKQHPMTAALVGLVLSLSAFAAQEATEPKVLLGAKVQPAIHFDTSPPLWLIPPAAPSPFDNVGPEIEKELDSESAITPWESEASTMTQAPSPRAAAPLLTNWLGLGYGFPGGSVTYGLPPDTAGDVGPSHYVQIVNAAFAIFDKATGNTVFGPVATNTLWSGFGGGCEINNIGEGTVLYDQISDRWVLSQIAAPNLLCVAVSQGSNPTGAWNRYAFSYPNTFPGFPKLAVWPDGYYVGLDTSPTSVCAMDRAKMLAGLAATQQCFNLPNDGIPLPSDLDGRLLPPPGSPNYILQLSLPNADTLNFFRFHVDWTAPGSSTLTGPTALPFLDLRPTALDLVAQPGTTQCLSTLGSWLMYRLAYRNFGDHESLVANRSVRVPTWFDNAQIDWFEIRSPATTPVMYQEGIFGTDDANRFFGSAAMDQAGNLAAGYSLSSPDVYPSIRYTGRLADDPLGQMTQGEGTIVDGTGSQTNSNRWGDYSMLTVDPSDDCTFWYTTEYTTVTGQPWSTRIASFKLPGCPPPLRARSAGPACAGGSIHLSVTGPVGATFAWTGPNGFTSSLANPAIAATAANAGIYNVSCTAFGSPCGSESVSVVVVGNGGACDDGNACTRVDTCQAGACVGGSPVDCAAFGCAAGACDPATGRCEEIAHDGLTCNDGNACVTGDSCQDGLCVSVPSMSGATSGYAPSVAFLASADLNFDGVPDLLTTGDQLVWTHLGLGDGTFYTLGYLVGLDASPVGVAILDPALPGQTLVAVAYHDSNLVELFFGDLNYGFTPMGTVYAGSGPVAVATGDFNQDGWTDLAVADATGNAVTVLLRTPFAPSLSVLGTWSADDTPTGVAVGDLNLDGRPDIVVSNGGSGDVTVLLNDGAGGFAPGMGSPLGAGRSPSGLAIGDFDGDGMLDVAAANELSSDVSVWLNRGSSGFVRAAGTPVALTSIPKSIVATDLNRDGKSDLAVLSNSDGEVDGLIGDGTGKFAAPFALSSFVGNDPRGLIAADLNLDGNPDLVVGLHADGAVHTFMDAAPLAPNGTACQDADPCFTGDTCSAGTCVGGTTPLDQDGDGRTPLGCPNGSDCNDNDPNVWNAPREMRRLVASGKATTTVSWDPQSGIGTAAYDLVSGSLTKPVNFAASICLQSGGGTSYADTRPNPAPGQAYWYLSRGRNSCGTGTWGSAQEDATMATCP
ncbi:MAG TPA: VCBS repeat-containing protein [Candidatus Polarisedimenticolaceae bacterium]|nr:VCBS repeat-containing protein [Candidatus Polarisedimenticolaceae bacterium]